MMCVDIGIVYKWGNVYARYLKNKTFMNFLSSLETQIQMLVFTS
jgi:hypothetical protein